jgi:hypothetical protein
MRDKTGFFGPGNLLLSAITTECYSTQTLVCAECFHQLHRPSRNRFIHTVCQLNRLKLRFLRT